MLKTSPFLLIFILFFCSCASRKSLLFNSSVPHKKQNPELPVYELQKGKDSSNLAMQVIAPGDLLSIRNLQNEDLISGINSSNQAMINNAINSSYRVENDGTVMLPVLGKTPIAGLTRIKAQELLNQLYQKDLLKNPIITLSIINLKVTLLGEFNKQGNYTLEKDQTHLVQLLGEAGGLSPRANKKKIKVIRGNLSHPEVFIVNLEDINSLADDRLYLKNNDIIYAEQKGAFRFLENINPATSFLGLGLSLVNVYFLIKTLSK